LLSHILFSLFRVLPVFILLAKLLDKGDEADDGQGHQDDGVDEDIYCDDPNHGEPRRVPCLSIRDEVCEHKQVVPSHQDSHLIEDFNFVVQRLFEGGVVAQVHQRKDAHEEVALDLEEGDAPAEDCKE